jgi:predicted SAM-dependent methyltransferase
VRRARRYASASGLKLHLGCGPIHKPGWINIDLFYPDSDLQLDAREPFPFRDGSASQVYSEHFFEHLSYPDEAVHVLRESLRVLAPGGLFTVGVPDMEKNVMVYVYGDEEYERNVSERWHPKWCDTRMHHLNYAFRQEGEHQYGYDFETLARILANAGFTGIKRRPWNPEMDQETRKDGTFYVEASKPAAAPVPSR